MTAALLSLVAVALVSVAIYLLEPLAPIVSLGVLYLFAVLPVAVIWGLPFAIPVSVVSMLAFNWLFLPPTHTFRLADSENWVALAVYLLTAISVSGLSARARRRAAEAEQRRREAALAAEVSALLLENRDVEPCLDTIAARTAALLGSGNGRIELGSGSPGEPDAPAHELVVGDRVVGRLFLDSGARTDRESTARVCSTIGSLLATAVDAEALRRSDAVKTAVLRSVSHDLRSPITAIMTASDVLEDSGDALTHAEREELHSSIRLQIQRLDRFVANMLDLSRLQAGAASPVPELWTVDGLIARALEAIGPENARIEVSVPEDSPPVSVDAAQLEHALVNLLENALKFSSVTDPVELRAESAGPEVILRITDHGPGIARDERASIFEPFHGSGSGLGLAIARGFVQLNGGRLWIESDPGRGTTFALAFPAVRAVERLGT